MSLNLTKSHSILLNLTKSHRISSNLTESHQISLNLTKSHQISSNLIKTHQISLNLIKSHQISSNLITSHRISSNLTESHRRVLTKTLHGTTEPVWLLRSSVIGYRWYWRWLTLGSKRRSLNRCKVCPWDHRYSRAYLISSWKNLKIRHWRKPSTPQSYGAGMSMALGLSPKWFMKINCSSTSTNSTQVSNSPLRKKMRIRAFQCLTWGWR